MQAPTSCGQSVQADVPQPLGRPLARVLMDLRLHAIGKIRNGCP
jgi:hypothetical protein